MKLDVQDGAASHRPTPPARMSPRRPGRRDRWRERDHGLAARGAAVDCDAELVACCCRWPGRSLRARCGATSRALRMWLAPKEAFEHRSVLRATTTEFDFRESWVGRPRRHAAQGEVPGGHVPVLERVLRQGVRGGAARVAARPHRVGVPRLRVRGGSRRPSITPRWPFQDGSAGRDRVQTKAFDAFRGGVSVPGRTLRAGQGLGGGFRRDGHEICQGPRVPAAAGGELVGAQRGDHQGAGDRPTRHRDDGGSIEEARRWSCGIRGRCPLACPRPPRRHAGRRQVRARPGGHGHVLGADPRRLPAATGEAVPRPGGDRGRRRGDRRASPGVLPGSEGPRCAVNGHPKSNELEQIVDRNILGSGIGHRQEPVRSWRESRCRPRRWRRRTRWWRGLADGRHDCRASAPGCRPEGAASVDGRGAVATLGRAGRPPASDAGRLPGAVWCIWR